MLQVKNLKSIFELQDFFKENENATETIIDVYRQFRICKTAQKLNNYKERGYIATDVLMVLILLSFTLSRSIYGMMKSGIRYMTEMEKDVYYRLKNNPKVDWRTILYSFAKRFVKISQTQSIDKNDGVRCMIVDDTVLHKTGKKIERIGKVYDHVMQRWVLGFKKLVLGFWDGKSFIPLDFSLHAEKGKNKVRPFGMKKKELKARYSKKRDMSDAGHKRIQELLQKKTDMMLSMIKRAVKHGFIPQYVLMDKWFTSEQVIRSIRKLKKGIINIIAACKKDKRKYLYLEKELSAVQILAMNKKKIKHCRSLKMLYIPIIAEYKGMQVKLFFNKASRQKNWELLITTDLKLSFKQAMEIYCLRWTIEVFFKECKQYLGLGKCQSNDFDSQISDTTISMMRYILLSLMKHFTSYETLGEAFSNTQIFMLELNLGQRIWNLFIQLCHSLCDILGIDYNELIPKLFAIPELQETIFRFFMSTDIMQNDLINHNNAA
jgi:hypothetical protein